MASPRPPRDPPELGQGWEMVAECQAGWGRRGWSISRSTAPGGKSHSINVRTNLAKTCLLQLQ